MKLKSFPVCRLLSTLLAGVAVVLLVVAPVAAAERQTPAFSNITSVATPAAIPLAEIALQATEFEEFLRASSAAMADSAEVDSIRRSLPIFSGEVAALHRETAELLRGYSTLSGLQAQQQLWQQKMARARSWLQVLTARARQLDVLLASLAMRQKGWTLTLEAGRASDVPDALLRQIESTLAEIEAARARLQRHRSTVIDLQILLARDIAVCGNALEEIASSQKSLVKGTFQPDSPPLWDAREWGNVREILPSYLRSFLGTIIAEFEQFASAPNLLLTLILSAAVLSLYLVARRRYRQWEAIESARSFASEVYEHPYCATLTVILLTLTSPMLEVPAHCRALLQAVSIVPMILLVRPSVRSRTFFWICAMGILFAIDSMRQLVSGVMSVGQAILVFESIVALAVTGWITAKGGGWSSASLLPSVRFELSRLISYVLLFCFAISLAAAVIGYMNLARLVAPSILVGGYLGLGLYASVRVASAAFGFFLHMWPLRQFRMVQNCRPLLEKRFYIVLIWVAVVGWIARFLYYLGLLEPASAFVTSSLKAKFERGVIAISLGDILAFSLTVWIAYLLSAVLRFVLREEIYPRLSVAHGRAYAASSLIHYFVLALGFVVAIGLMGVNLTKVTVLAGALGVGIGFGLQSVVNNFVSGLILLFERPVSAGDSIEVGELLGGEVRRIGMRSSTVRTWQGADIIVPNSVLISEKVTNWTFSDRRRRIEIPVGLNYGADPKKVMRLLVELAEAHPDILKKPPPWVLFLGCGDSSINFELRAWTDRFDDWPRVRSDLVVAVYDAVSNEADLNFPFPQRDVHLVCDPVSARATITPSPAGTKE